MTKEHDEIRQLFEEVYPDCLRTGDVQDYEQLYTEDALCMGPNVPDRRGIHDIGEGFTQQIAKQKIESAIFTAEEIEVIGNIAYVTGISIFEIHPRDGSSPEIVRYRDVWITRKEEGTWKIHRQIWNVKSK